MRALSKLTAVVVAVVIVGCGANSTSSDAGVQPDGGVLGDGGLAGNCPATSDDIGLPPGLCATIAADHLALPRHMTFSPSGDLYVASSYVPGVAEGKILALRDADKDGVFEVQESFHTKGGNGIFWFGGFLYFAEPTRVIRFALPDGTLTPSSAPEVIVEGLPATGDHYAKTIIVDDSGNLFVNIGSATNSCQLANRVAGSPGIDPCPELDVRAGVWRYSATTLNQTHNVGARFGKGLRNATAIAISPETDALYGIINGRDQLHDNWPTLFTEEQDVTLPGEEFFQITANGDYGWPYCFYNPAMKKKVLAPEYGGNGMLEGRCSSTVAPLTALPAHWSPLSMLFYNGGLLPAKYKAGVFMANHGNRFTPNAVLPPGYNVVFMPFTASTAPTSFEVFADKFAGDARPLPDAAAHRPIGLAEAPDGALFISDDKGGRLWRIAPAR